MLGQTVKWLRLLGIDAEYASQEARDEALLEKAKKEDRIIVTRDKTLGESDQAFLVPKLPSGEIVSIILSSFDLEIDPLSRCSLCNSLVSPIEKDIVKGEVPDGVYEKQVEFWQCDGCNKIYWKGTHWDHIKSNIDLIEND